MVKPLMNLDAVQFDEGPVGEVGGLIEGFAKDPGLAFLDLSGEVAAEFDDGRGHGRDSIPNYLHPPG